jgi:hypothetical protein
VRLVRWYCPACQIESEGDGGPCPECSGERARDRRVHEPDLPAMGPQPSEDWVAVWLPADHVEADEVQEFLEGVGIPALVLPEWAEWAGSAPAEEDEIVHVAVPRDRAAEARRALIALLAA